MFAHDVPRGIYTGHIKPHFTRYCLWVIVDKRAICREIKGRYVFYVGGKTFVSMI